MLNSKEVNEYIHKLMIKSTDTPYVAGNGVLTSTHVGFDQVKLEEQKPEIASMLQEIGIENSPLISLERLTKLKNGEVWNQLQSLEDLQALDLLLACANASGFILNNGIIIQMNINEIGDLTSILISGMGRSMVGDDAKWLEEIRNRVVNKMFFPVDGEKIMKAFETRTTTPTSSERPIVPIMEFGARRPEEPKE